MANKSKTLSTQPYKGARDFYPEVKRLQKYLFNRLKDTVESYGYEEYDAPLIEPIELYLAKTGQEIVSEQAYVFTDRGGREVAIRPEMTPSVSRMVAARRQELAYPLRWYSIPNLWRYERPQKGRLREHWQLNVDIFGIDSLQAELEVILVAEQIFKDLGANADSYKVKLNHRQLVNHVLVDYIGLNPKQAVKVTKLIDRKAKMEPADFIEGLDAILTPSQRTEGLSEKLLSVLSVRSLDQLPKQLLDSKSAVELKDVLSSLEHSGVNNCEFDISIMRGLDYYSGIVFEIFDTHPENNRSMMGGGRYDGLVGLFGVDPVPAVGFAIGDVTLASFIKLHNLVPDLKPETDIFLATIGEVSQDVLKLADRLRQDGLKVAVDFSDKRLGEKLKTAQKKGLSYVLIVGENELKAKVYTLRNLTTSKETKLKLEDVVSTLKS